MARTSLRTSTISTTAILQLQVEIFAVHNMQFRRLRAKIPGNYLNSLASGCRSGILVDGFIIVEQSSYINTLSEDCIIRMMDAIFELFSLWRYQCGSLERVRTFDVQQNRSEYGRVSEMLKGKDSAE